jgi:uncharacterized membrane protein YeiB
MIVLGIILLAVALLTKLAVLWAIGTIVTVVGLILAVLGGMVVPSEAGGTTTEDRRPRDSTAKTQCKFSSMALGGVSRRTRAVSSEPCRVA